MKVQYPKCAYGPYCSLNPIGNGLYILEAVSSYIIDIDPRSHIRGQGHSVHIAKIHVRDIYFFIW